LRRISAGSVGKSVNDFRACVVECDIMYQSCHRTRDSKITQSLSGRRVVTERG